MKIVRERLNEIKRGEDVRSAIGVGRKAHLREFYGLIDEYHFLKINQHAAKDWKTANETIANALGCDVSELRFTSFYYDGLWGKMEDWFGPSDGELEIHHESTPTRLIKGKVWKDRSLIVFNFKDLVMGGKTYHQIYTTKIGMNILAIEMNLASIEDADNDVNEIRKAENPLDAMNVGANKAMSDLVISTLNRHGELDYARPIDHVSDRETKNGLKWIAEAFECSERDVLVVDDESIESYVINEIAEDLLQLMNKNSDRFPTKTFNSSDRVAAVTKEVTTISTITANRFVAVIKRVDYTVINGKEKPLDIIHFMFINSNLVNI